MQWIDDGIVLGVKRHGEASAIVEMMTREHGRHLGMVRGGAGSRWRPVLQPGNALSVTWRARLDEHLGNYAVEGLDLRAGSYLSASHALYGLTHIAALCRLLAEREPHAAVYVALDALLACLSDIRVAAPLIARFELALLAELGFGLDLDACAATGTSMDLVYVSPKSGRAVSRAAGAAYHDRLLRLPAFLREDIEPACTDDVLDAFAVTGFFLARHALEPRGLALPDARAHFLTAMARGLAKVA